MKLGLDIDNTITRHPKMFAFMAHAWLASGGEVYFVTARCPSAEQVTVELLNALGFGNILQEDRTNLLMYPFEYTYPYKDAHYEHLQRNLHASWKARVCHTLGIDVLYDDCDYNVAECRKGGTTVFHVTQ